MSIEGRYAEQLVAHRTVATELTKEIKLLVDEQHKMQDRIVEINTRLHYLHEASEANGKVLSSYQFLNAAEDSERPKILKSELSELGRIQEILKQLDAAKV